MTEGTGFFEENITHDNVKKLINSGESITKTFRHGPNDLIVQNPVAKATNANKNDDLRKKFLLRSKNQNISTPAKPDTSQTSLAQETQTNTGENSAAKSSEKLDIIRNRLLLMKSKKQNIPTPAQQTPTQQTPTQQTPTQQTPTPQPVTLAPTKPDTKQENNLDLVQFLRIYNALYQGQTTVFKKQHGWTKQSTQDQIKQYAKANPKSRTAEALELTKKHMEKQLDHSELFQAIHKSSYAKSSLVGFFKRSKNEQGLKTNPEKTIANAEKNSRTFRISKALKS